MHEVGWPVLLAGGHFVQFNVYICIQSSYTLHIHESRYAYGLQSCKHSNCVYQLVETMSNEVVYISYSNFVFLLTAVSFLFSFFCFQFIQNRTIQAILKKITQSNLCLICNVQFANEIAVQHHFLNVHHTGTFACKVFGCTHVEKTNGDLRMHHCLWHSELVSSNFSLPVSVSNEIALNVIFFYCVGIIVKRFVL